MKHLKAKTLFERVEGIKDPRMERKKLHSLKDILVIAVCATICGANDWEDIAEFGVAKQEWFSSFLELENGIPSHDTFRRVFILLDKIELKTLFSEWVSDVVKLGKGALVNLDGKNLGGSKEPIKGKKALNVVSAWASEQSVVLGQVRCEEKSNEITAIPELLNILMLEGCIVTIDASAVSKGNRQRNSWQRCRLCDCGQRQSRQFTQRHQGLFGLGRAQKFCRDKIRLL